MSGDEVARLAKDAAPGVLAAALERAHERAVERLADLLTDAIVAQALGGVATAAAPADPASAPPADPASARPANSGAPAAQPTEATGEALYAYGITLADVPVAADVPALTGDARVERVEEAELALLVSPVRPDQLRVDEDDLSETGRLATLARGHDAVVRAAATTGPVLPLRFGTVVPDRAAARRLLAEHAGSAAALLRRIGRTREWGVKLLRRLAPEPVAAGPRADRAGLTGTEYLARRKQALEQSDAAERAAAQAAETLEETLRPHVTESLRRGGAAGSSLLLDLALLVTPERETDFLAAAAELREWLAPEGLEVEVSGPWPPYSFASLDTAGTGGGAGDG